MTAARAGRLFGPSNLTGSLRLYLAANVGTRVLGLVRTVVLTRLMVQASFGHYGLALLLVNLLAPLAILGCHETLARYVPAHEGRPSVRPFLRRQFVVAGVAAVVTAGLLAILAPYVAGPLFARLAVAARNAAETADDTTRVTLTLAVAVAMLSLGCYHVVVGLLRGARMFAALSLVELCAAVLFTVLGIGVVYAAWWPAAPAMLGSFCIALWVPAIAFGVPALVHLTAARSQIEPPNADRLSRFSTLNSRLSPRPARAEIGFGLGVALAALLWQLVQFVPAWRLNRLEGADQAAVLFAARQITQLIAAVAFTVSVPVAAAVTKRWVADGPRAADHQWAVSFKATSLTLLAAAALLSAGRTLLVLLFDPSYRAGAAEAMPVLFLFALLGGNQCLLAIHFTLLERTRRLMFAWLVGLAAAVAMAEPLIESGRPVVGAAWTAVVAITVTLALSLVLLSLAGRRFDRGTWILLGAPILLAGPDWLLLLGVTTLLVVTAATNAVFTPDQRHTLRTSLARIVNLRTPA